MAPRGALHRHRGRADGVSSRSPGKLHMHRTRFLQETMTPPATTRSTAVAFPSAFLEGVVGPRAFSQPARAKSQSSNADQFTPNILAFLPVYCYARSVAKRSTRETSTFWEDWR